MSIYIVISTLVFNQPSICRDAINSNCSVMVWCIAAVPVCMCIVYTTCMCTVCST